MNLSPKEENARTWEEIVEEMDKSFGKWGKRILYGGIAFLAGWLVFAILCGAALVKYLVS